MDRIEVHGIACEALIGVRAAERSDRQPLRIDVAVDVDLSLAAASDRFSDTLDYVRIVKVVEELLRDRPFCLVEGVAGAICDQLLQWDRVRKVTVEVRKFPRTLRGRVDSVGVRLERRRPPAGSGAPSGE